MITLNFQETLDRVYNAKKGVEVRYGLGQGFEYCEQYAATATTKAGEAEASAKRAENAVSNIDQQKNDAVKAVQQAQTTATDAVTETKNAALQEVADATADAKNAASAADRSATAAAGSASTASGAATTATTKADKAATSATQASTSQKKAAENQQAAEDAANRAAAIVSTDKTLSVDGAPADAKAVGDIILNRTKDPPEAIFYSKAEVDALLTQHTKDTLLAAYPVGSLYMSAEATSPAELFGGTWEQIKDCTVWGASDTHPAGTMMNAGLPNITGRFSFTSYGDAWLQVGAVSGAFEGAVGNGAVASLYTNVTQKNVAVYMSAANSNKIYGASKTVQPPAYCLYIWHRVA